MKATIVCLFSLSFFFHQAIMKSRFFLFFFINEVITLFRFKYVKYLNKINIRISTKELLREFSDFITTKREKKKTMFYTEELNLEELINPFFFKKNHFSYESLYKRIILPTDCSSIERFHLRI